MDHLVRSVIALALLLGLVARPGMAQPLESQIKSAYVLNFVKFTEWPAEVMADDNLTLCVVGDNVLDGALAELIGRNAGGRELQVIHYATEKILNGQPNVGHALGRCQVVFIGESEQRRFVPIIKALGNAPALTISDIEDFAEKGGCIGLRYRDNKIVFEINLAAANKAKLRLPAQLLNLASYVFGR